MFDFIPTDHVIIDTLHLFLRVSDVLIDLLIRDIQYLDGTSKDQPHTTQYQQFLNEKCKIHFRFYTDKESNKMKW